jgi:CO/xanthine dehydrogenase FAD-binding subunit
MHSDPAAFTITQAPSLDDALALLAQEPGRHTPIAGGTELMVAFNTGRLAARSLLSIQHLEALRFIRLENDRLHLGAATTFTDIRRHPAIAQHWPLLAQAASWTGSIANQNRGTLGGNICNASPAADTPPALLAYNADITLISASGQRTLPYRDFHLGYKKTALRPDELLYSLSVARPPQAAHQYIRKVGTRNAQAISKTAIAAIAELDQDQITTIRLGAASLADRPLRLTQTEAALQNASTAPAAIDATIKQARAALSAEANSIDDIRSTARYRTHVAANLVEEFLRSLNADSRGKEF